MQRITNRSMSESFLRPKSLKIETKGEKNVNKADRSMASEYNLDPIWICTNLALFVHKVKKV